MSVYLCSFVSVDGHSSRGFMLEGIKRNSVKIPSFFLRASLSGMEESPPPDDCGLINMVLIDWYGVMSGVA